VIILRRAEQKDWAKLLSWKNDPAALAGSLSTGEVGVEAHLKWFKDTLGRDSVRLYVARNEHSEEVGTARVDKVNATTVEVSLTVAPSYRGRGYAEQILSALEATVRAEFGGKATIRAAVKETNYASLRAFAACDYDVRKVKGGVVELVRQNRTTEA
jgi:L-amino acid N-acyltransferase YncA